MCHKAQPCFYLVQSLYDGPSSLRYIGWTKGTRTWHSPAKQVGNLSLAGHLSDDGIIRETFIRCCWTGCWTRKTPVPTSGRDPSKWPPSQVPTAGPFLLPMARPSHSIFNRTPAIISQHQEEISKMDANRFLPGSLFQIVCPFSSIPPPLNPLFFLSHQINLSPPTTFYRISTESSSSLFN